jgi:para-nitrobenzyl esterase
MDAVIATTHIGKVRGQPLDGPVLAFKGIPYAAPPVGRLRFRPPQPAEPWSDVRDARTLPPSCPQPKGRPAGWTQETQESEDCLYLNVWTPDLVGDRPVMVWFHGGGYAIGSGSWPLYDGASLARRGDVVVVTVNHRLGPLGYLHLGELSGDPELASSGNAGMLDLVAVLEWVQENAAAFGGDAGNVTIFGESGGGAKVSTLLAMPAARGLFHRAIIQSGPGVRVGSVARATEGARSFLKDVGVPVDDLEKLWALPAEALVAASASVGRAGFRPVLDGVTVTAHPGEALAAGTAADVPIMIGCNQDEGAGTLPRALDEDGLRQRLAIHGEDHVEEILDVYRRLFPDASPIDILSATLTDSRMRAGSVQLAEAQDLGMAAPAFQYFFTYSRGGRAGHGYEIAFAFDNLGAEAAGSSAQDLADRMSEAWLAFARTGDPNHDDIPKWPPYTAGERATMVFGREVEVALDPSGPARELWARLAADRARRTG